MEMPRLLRPTTVLLSIVILSACGSPAPGSPSPSVAASVPPSAPSSESPSPGSPSPSAPAVRVERSAPMLRARTGFDAVVLGDGTVLAVGDDVACLPGPAEPGSETAERYDPAADRWTEAASLNKPRKSFATVRLSDGRAMVMGGTNPDDQLYSSTKLFDPKTGSWTDGPLLDVARADPAAVTLADGRVLVGSVVARGETGDTSTTELLDAGATAWSAGPPIDGFGVLSFIRLTDDRVLAVGFGFEVDVALELFDPATGTWTPIDGPRVVRQPRFVPIDGGDVLAFGYEEVAEGQQLSTRVERFDGETGAWTEVAPMATAREGAQVTTLADGRVFVAGGAVYDADGSGVQATVTTELYDPVADGWSTGPDLLEPRKDGGALVLPDGSVLIHGGDASFNTQGDVPFCPDPMVATERIYLGT